MRKKFNRINSYQSMIFQLIRLHIRSKIIVFVKLFEKFKFILIFLNFRFANKSTIISSIMSFYNKLNLCI